MTDLKRGDWCAESGFLRDGKCRNPDECTCDAIAAAILALAPADALAEVQRLREELKKEEAAGAAMIRGCRILTDDLRLRAEKAEAERDAALARVEKLRHQITEASDAGLQVSIGVPK